MQNIVVKNEILDFRTREAFNTLRSNIEFSRSDIKFVAITSCTPNEGKSEISYHLAKSFAQNEQKVLLIDADLRKSVMRRNHKSGKVRLGLSHYLIGRNTIEEVICETDIPDFHMIFAGPVPPNPSELLSGRYFTEMLQYGAEHYDYVIIDTPPLGSVIDGAIIARQCDGVALVLQSGAISYRFAQKIISQLKMSDCRILGCILNKVEMNRGKYYGKYYGRYYGKYYGEYYDENDIE